MIPKMQNRRGEVQLARRQGGRHDQQPGRDGDTEDDLRGAHFREPAEHLRDGAHLTGGLPARHLTLADPADGGTAGHQQAEDHDDEQHRVDIGRLVPVPDHGLLHDPEHDRGDHDRGQPFHPADHRGSQGPQQDRRAEDLADRQPDDPGAQEHGEEGQDGRQDPHDGLQASDRDPERRRPVGPLSAGPDRDPEVAAPKEQGQRGEHERHRRDGDDVGPAEHDRVDGDVQVERCRDGVAGQREVPGQQEGACREHLGDPDRGHAQDEAGSVREAPYEQQLDRGADDQRGGETGREGEPPVQGQRADHEQHGEGGGHGAEIPGREVDDPVGVPHQRQPEREQRGERSDDRALHEHAGRDVPPPGREHHDREPRRPPGRSAGRRSRPAV